MSAFHDVILAGASGSQGYQISRSVRLRSSASAYFSRTPAGAGTSNKTFTYSAWVKRGALGSIQNLISSPNTGNSDSLRFSAADALEYNWQDTAVGQVTTTQVFRDPSAWYHIMFAMDTTQATASNRFKLYVNGVQVTAFATASYPAQNTVVNNTAAVATKLGQYANSSAQSFDGYLTEINFIDGQALTPSSFGEYNTITGVWQPKRYTGTYGTNGFYLNFSDNSAATAAAIGKDYSGNGNNWTPNNISVTSGVTYDSMIDTPTAYADGGNGRGNYAVINPLSTIAFPVTNGNLSIGAATTSNRCSKSSIAVSSGKWYWEFKASAMSASGQIAGICSADAVFSGGVVSTGYEVGYYSINGNKYVNGTASAYGASWTTSDTIGVALDVDSGTVTFYKNNTSQGSISITAGQNWVANWTGQNTTDTVDFNFGQRPFTYTPPTGFKALNTQNLPDSTIKKGNQYFNAVTWTGDGVDGRTITGVGFNPDLVWAKGRSNTGAHVLADAVRGTNANLYTNLTDAETNPTTGASGGGIGSVTTDGFVLEQGSTNMDLVNTSSRTYVAWQWKESATAGFDIVTFTNPSSGSSSFAHNLGVKPSMIIVKSRSNTSNWTTMHKSLGTNMADNWINLESTAAKQTSTNIWGGEPTSSVFFCGTGIQVAGATMVAYLFAEVAGYSAFGSYTGNGSSDGPFVYCGFRPRWVMLKRTDTTASWAVIDTSRDTYNAAGLDLYPNLSNAEGDDRPVLDIISNGFKLRSTYASTNASGGTYIFAAFAETAFKFSLGR